MADAAAAQEDDPNKRTQAAFNMLLAGDASAVTALDPVISMEVDSDDVVIVRTADGKTYQLPTQANLDRAAARFIQSIGGDEDV